MRYQSFTVLSLAAFSVAAPTPKRALKARQAGPVLASTTYNDISISGGQAGNAEAEALAIFSALDLANPGNIDPADIDFLGQVNDVANDAETEAFNPAIEAATGDEADQIQNGKTKNKVMKLMATKIELEAKAAQGEDVAAKLAEETTKLNNNIALDEGNAGQPSIAEPFDATITGGGNVAAGAGGGANAAAAQDNAAAGANNAAQGNNAQDDEEQGNAAAGANNNNNAQGNNAQDDEQQGNAAAGANGNAQGNNAQDDEEQGNAVAGGNGNNNAQGNNAQDDEEQGNAAAGANNNNAQGNNAQDDEEQGNAAAGANNNAQDDEEQDNAAAGANANAGAGRNRNGNAQGNNAQDDEE